METFKLTSTYNTRCVRLSCTRRGIGLTCSKLRVHDPASMGSNVVTLRPHMYNNNNMYMYM